METWTTYENACDAQSYDAGLNVIFESIVSLTIIRGTSHVPHEYIDSSFL